MTSLQVLYQKLEEYSDFDKNDNSEKFLDILDEIAVLKDPQSIPILLKYLKDSERDYGWVLQSVCKALEHNDVQPYVIELLKNMHVAFDNGKEWLIHLLYGLLNHDEGLEILRQNMNITHKAQLLELLNIIETESKDHKSLVQSLKEEMNFVKSSEHYYKEK